MATSPSPTLTGMLLDKGTTKQDKFAIAEKLESVGATHQFRVGKQMIEVSAKCLKKDVPLVIGLIAEQLRTPALSAEEFEKAKKQFAGMLQRQLEDTNFRAADAFTRAVYPVGHPNRSPRRRNTSRRSRVRQTRGGRRVPQKTLRSRPLHDRGRRRPRHPAAPGEIGKAFAGWTGGVPVIVRPKRPATDAPKEQDVFMPGKTSVSS